ncbi:MAG: ClpXP protease specificity-enhancing factor [Thermomonas sp.]
MGEPAPPVMSSQRPYLLRALYEWIADNGMTPHVLVDARMNGVRVPAHAVKDGRIVLNIAERAVAKLELGNDALRFTARFAGVSQSVMVPLEAVIAVYARETGQGMAMPDEPRASAPAPAQESGVEVEQAADAQSIEEPETPDTPPEPPKRGGHLRIVK